MKQTKTYVRNTEEERHPEKYRAGKPVLTSTEGEDTSWQIRMEETPPEKYSGGDASRETEVGRTPLEI